MNNTILLIKAQLINSLGINKFKKGSTIKDKVKFGLFAALIVFVGLLIFAQMTAYAWVAADYLVKINAMNVLIIVGSLLSTMVCLFMSIYKASGYLFAFKDFDLLMSLPISKRSILTSKLFMIVVTNAGLSLIIGFPFLMIYGIRTSVSAVFYLLALLSLIIVSLVPVVIGAVISLLLGRVSSKSKYTNLILTLGSFVVFGALMIGMFSINSLTTNNISQIVDILKSVTSIYYPFGLFIDILENLNIVSLAVFGVISIIIYMLFVFVFSRSFSSINTKMQEKYKASNYKMTELKVQTKAVALFKKELGFFFSSYIYVFNMGFGVIMMVISTIMFIVSKSEITKVFSVIPMNISMSILVTLIMSLSTSLCCTTAPSISLEGKNIWIIKTMPINVIDIFKGKMWVNIVVTAPIMIICTTILSIIFKFTFLEYILAVAIGCGYSVLIALIGLIINLHFPKMEWNTQVTVVKQSASVAIAVGAGFLVNLVPIIIFAAIQPTNLILFKLIWFAGVALLAWASYGYLKKRGAALFRAL